MQSDFISLDNQFPFVELNLQILYYNKNVFLNFFSHFTREKCADMRGGVSHFDFYTPLNYGNVDNLGQQFMKSFCYVCKMYLPAHFCGSINIFRC